LDENFLFHSLGYLDQLRGPILDAELEIVIKAFSRIASLAFFGIQSHFVRNYYYYILRLIAIEVEFDERSVA
jgi:hypothetical protein